MEKLKNTSIDFKVGKTNYGYSQFKNMSKILSFMEVIVMKDIWRKLIKIKSIFNKRFFNFYFILNRHLITFYAFKNFR